MTPYYDDGAATIYCGDCIEVMAEMPENSVDAIVTDPPYGLEFMGKEWDKLAPDIPQWVRDRMSGADAGHSWQGEAYRERGNYLYHRLGKYKARLAELQQLWHQQWATRALRVLKPGGYLLAFGGTRTSHRLVCGLEDAGFEIRDTICWLYGSGFPKSLDISKQIDKMAGADRETIGYSQQHLDKIKNPRNLGSNLYGVDSRVGEDAGKLTTPATEAAKEWQGWGTALKPAFEPIVVARKPLSEKNVASNALKWGTGGLAIDECRIGIEQRDNIYAKNPHTDGTIGAKGIYGAGKPTRYSVPQGRWPANVILDEEAAMMLDEQSGDCKTGGLKPYKEKGASWFTNHNMRQVHKEPNSGGASRFFYVAKASRLERGKGNIHPTCKPVALMEYLIKLVSKPGATILDPFAGSMSTVLAAVALGRKCIAIEQSEEYCEMLKNRCRQIHLGV